MNISEFEKFLTKSSVSIIEGGKTVLDSYIFIPKSRLDSSANRLNSTWIRAQFIILNEPQTREEILADLNKWKNLSIHDDQFFLVNSNDDGWEIYNHNGDKIGNEEYVLKLFSESPNLKQGDVTETLMLIRAMRTKPFLLLAGISGTGKSRIVKQMAFDSCPNNNVLRSDPTSPGNYCLIEVKPNWHDSTELLGYESKINGNTYQLTHFVKFLAKAMLYPDVPFFVCLDEMNLAPVEQYFAEFLSVLESRMKLKNGHIISEPLIKSSIFTDYEEKISKTLFDKENYEIRSEITTDELRRITNVDRVLNKNARKVYDDLKEHGLRIPENVIVIGTVNMDETTHQFSRKVIDRAMTIEMNLPEGKDADGNDKNPFIDFFTKASELEYRVNPISSSLYLATETKASDVIKVLATDNAVKTEWLKAEVAKVLTDINSALESTPFKVAYRVQNELLLYFYQLISEIPKSERTNADWESLLRTATDQILMMKVLPRVEGDNELLKDPLKSLISFCEGKYPNASKKLKEINDRFEWSQFTSFWP